MGDTLQVQQSAMFKRAYKRLHPNQKADVDDAVADIVRDPTIGEAKKGDLAGVLCTSSSVMASCRCWLMNTTPAHFCCCWAAMKISTGI